MRLIGKLFSSDSGGIIILIAVMLPLLISILGLTVDVGRMYAVRSRAQNAADAALTGAVSTAATISVVTEATNLFNANFNGYMGATVGTITVTQVATGQYTISIPVTVPSLILSNSGPMTITARVNSGYQLAAPQQLELALVLDNSGNIKTPDINTAARSLVCLIFGGAGAPKCSGGASSMSNVYVSVVPFDVDVNVGDNRVSWIQTFFVPYYDDYIAQAANPNGFISNRNSDDPPNALIDASDAAPMTDDTRFRVPYDYNNPNCNGTGNNKNKGSGKGKGKANCNGTLDNSADYVTPSLVSMQFGLSTRTSINSALGAMKATGGNRRTNVGLMWGWFALSPNWRGLWNAGLPGLPLDDNPLVSKNVVLVVGGANNVYVGQPQYAGGPAQSSDDTTTTSVCQAIVAKGIRVFTVGYGPAGTYNATMLENCASNTSYYYTATDSSQLTAVFQSIANHITSSTLRLSQ